MGWYCNALKDGGVLRIRAKTRLWRHATFLSRAEWPEGLLIITKIELWHTNLRIIDNFKISNFNKTMRKRFSFHLLWNLLRKWERARKAKVSWHCTHWTKSLLVAICTTRNSLLTCVSIRLCKHIHTRVFRHPFSWNDNRKTWTHGKIFLDY